MRNNLNRRQFLKIFTLIGTASGLTALSCQKSLIHTISQAFNNKNYLPLVLGGQASTLTPTSTTTNTPTQTNTHHSHRLLRRPIRPPQPPQQHQEPVQR